MRQLNHRMAAEIGGSEWSDHPLPSELGAVAAKGFIETDGCYFLEELFQNGASVSQRDFPDQTGYECFINSVHVDDYVEGCYLAVALHFAETLLTVWRQRGLPKTLNVIVSSDEMGAVVKCHVVRDGQSWLAEDLNKYEEAIMKVDSTFKGRISEP
jgi:hypothetical protein